MFGRIKKTVFISKNLKNNLTPQNYLIAPLDWGLGHATRCIPLISYLLGRGNRVFVCGECGVEKLIKKEFPRVEFLHLPGYRISYSKSRKTFWYKMLLQLPKIGLAIKRERKWLSPIIDQYKIDCVISDNRLGLYNNKAYTIFMTHQLGIKTGTKLFDYLAQKINYSFINRFNECWIPDIDDDKSSIAGELSHPQNLPAVPIKYIGLLSRIHPTATQTQYDIAAILSGPEPQRTLFEKKVKSLLTNYSGSAIIIRGLPGETKKLEGLPSNIKQANHLDTKEMSLLMQGSLAVICRSGYSTVMDVLKIGKPALLVPTPGQTEQEYLAQRLHDLGYFLCIDQDSIYEETIKNIIPSKRVDIETFSLFEKELFRVEQAIAGNQVILPNR